MNNLVFHYQLVQHNLKQAVYLHEAFSTRSGELYSINPLPVEVTGENEEEVEINLQAMETDSAKYKPVKINAVVQQMSRWTEDSVSALPKYEDVDPEELEEDYYGTDGEVLDCVAYFNKRK